MPSPRPASRRAAGFTLIEIMVVVAIIGLLMTLVAPRVYNYLRSAQITTTEAKMTKLKQDIGLFRLAHNGKLPDSLEGMLEPDEKNMNEPWVLQEDLQDAWGNQFQYTKLSSQKYDLVSFGADGVEGGEADDKDIHSADTDMPGSNP